MPGPRDVARAALLAWLAACAASEAAMHDGDPVPIRVASVGTTQAVPVNEVDDAAIWIHPVDPTKSVLFVGNELHGLEVHDLDGMLKKHVDPQLHVNAVDILYDFDRAGAHADLVFTTCIAPEFRGVRAWWIDRETGKVTTATADRSLPVLGDKRLLGLCTYRSRKSGRSFVFVTAGDGSLEQHEVRLGAKAIELALVRSFALPTKTEGCVADEERGVVYFAEEDTGIHRFAAEPDAPTTGTLVAKVGEHGLRADVEGLALYEERNGRGYLIAVCQGPKGGTSTLSILERDGENEFVALVQPVDEAGDAIDRASGVAVTNRPTSAQFPHGFVVVGDRTNANASEDFELIPWERIARAASLRSDEEGGVRTH